MPRVLAPLPAPPDLSLVVRPLRDDLIDSLGYDPRSSYVETYWLGILGPSTTWLLRRIVAGLEESPAGFALDLTDTAQRLGLGDRGGKHSPFMRAVSRLVSFDLAELRDPAGEVVGFGGPGGVPGPDDVFELAVRRKVPPLNRRQIVRLPTSLQALHQQHQEANLRRPPLAELVARARRLALTLLELGEDLEATERQLLRWRFHPALARDASAWAWEKHREAAHAAGVPVAPVSPVS